jgi:hypothetical protein
MDERLLCDDFRCERREFLARVKELETKLHSQAKELWDALERETVLTSRLDAISSICAELEADHEDNDTFDAGVKYAVHMVMARNEPVAENRTRQHDVQKPNPTVKPSISR